MRVVLTLLALAVWAPQVRAQITVPIAELAQGLANLVAVATVEQARKKRRDQRRRTEL